MIPNHFPELAVVQTRGWNFWRHYFSHALRYPLFFFCNAPVKKWHTLVSSTRRVAWDCARAECALDNEPDIWNRNALRGRFLRWGEQKL
jgi:hypothetical protein